jgi:hypothetical protein
MKNLLKLEELALTALAIYLFTLLDFAWWWLPLLFFMPDLSMIGYIAGPRVGAYTYNFVHHKAVAVTVYVIGAFTGTAGLQLAGVILLAHSSFDRVLGYGLKYPDAFSHTHLGMIGKAAQG